MVLFLHVLCYNYNFHTFCRLNMSEESSDDEDFGYEDLEFGIGDNNVVDSVSAGSEGVGLEDDREGAVEEGAAVVENEKEKADMQNPLMCLKLVPKMLVLILN